MFIVYGVFNDYLVRLVVWDATQSLHNYALELYWVMLLMCWHDLVFMCPKYDYGLKMERLNGNFTFGNLKVVIKCG